MTLQCNGDEPALNVMMPDVPGPWPTNMKEAKRILRHQFEILWIRALKTALKEQNYTFYEQKRVLAELAH